VVYKHDYVCRREMATAIGVTHFGYRYRRYIRFEDMVHNEYDVGRGELEVVVAVTRNQRQITGDVQARALVAGVTMGVTISVSLICVSCSRAIVAAIGRAVCVSVQAVGHSRTAVTSVGHGVAISVQHIVRTRTGVATIRNTVGIGVRSVVVASAHITAIRCRIGIAVGKVVGSRANVAGVTHTV